MPNSLDGCQRFIPADAGNSHGDAEQPDHKTVYPRWRGELTLQVATRQKQNGLSPLARGTPCPVELLQNLLRFIPAGAGNSGAQVTTAFPPPVYPRWRGELLL